MKKLTLSILLFFLLAPLSLLRGECKYYRITWTEITINSSCYVASDGGGLEDPTINIYCADGSTLNYSSEWEINIPSTGTYPIPAINWNFCSDTNEFLFGPVPNGMTSIDFFLEFFESDDSNCIDHADGSDDCITTGIGTLDLTPGIGQLGITGNTDVYFMFILEEIGEVIENINVGIPQCSPNNSYEIEIEVSYNFSNFCNLFPNSTPELIVNGNSYVITGSPQNITLSNLPSDGNNVDITVALSDNGCEKIFLDAFTAPSIPNALIDAPDGYTINCYNNSITLDGTASIGDLPLNYNWSTAEINSSINANNLGNYQLTVTSNYGCTAVADVEVDLDITFPEAIIVSDHDTINCHFPQISLDGSFSSGNGTLTYLWSNWLTNSNIGVDNSGLYALTVTDINNGCTNTTDITIWEDFQDPMINLELPDGDSLNCILTNLDILSNSIDMDLTYFWNTGDTVQNINVTAPGIYQVTVSSTNGCTNTTDITIWEDTLGPMISLELPDGDSINCNQTNLDILSNSVDTILTYAWSTGDSVQNINVTDPGMYQVTVSSTNGCTSTADTLIFVDGTVPDLVFQLPQGNILTCNNPEITIDAQQSTGDGNLIFTWENGISDASLSVDQPGYYKLTITDTKGCSVSDSIEIIEDLSTPDIIFYAPSGDTLDCDQTVLILDASLSLGDSVLLFDWSSGQDQNIININSPGTYYLTITQENGCFDVDSFEIYENLVTPNIELDFPNGQILNCNQSTIIVDANNTIGSGDIDFQWSTGDTTDLIEILTEGIFNLTVTDENGCSSIEEIEILAHLTAPEIAFFLSEGDTLDCDKTNLIVDAGVSLGDSTLVYNWSTGIEQNEIIAMTPGVYVLTVTQANGCTDIDSIVIYENIEAPTILLNYPEGNVIDCENSSVLVAAGNSIGQGTLGYSWSTGEVSNEISLSASGTYYLSITDINGCTTVDSFTIESNSSIPVIDINFPNGDTLNCIETVLLIDASLSQGEVQLSFLWNTGNTTEEITVVNPGSYILTVTDINGCYSSTEIEIIEDIINPEAIIDIPFGSTLYCDLDSVILDASLSQSQGSLEYYWNTTSTDAQEAAHTTGSYVVTITDINGCTDTNSIEVDQIDDLVVDYHTESPSCIEGFDGNIVINEISGGSPPYFYQIDNNPLVAVTSIPIVISNLGNPEYELTIIDSSNCIFKDTAIIPQGEESFVELGNDITIDLGESETIQINTNITNPNIIWNPSDFISKIGTLEFQVSPETSTTYTIEVSDVNGCHATNQITVFVNASANKIYIPNVFSPTSNNEENRVFTFCGEFQNIKAVQTFTVYDRWGNTLYDINNSTVFSEVGWDGLVYGQIAEPAIYIYHIVIEYKEGNKETFIGDFLLLR